MSFSMKRYLGDRKTFHERGLKPDFIFNCLTLDNSNSPSTFSLFHYQNTTIASNKVIGRNNRLKDISPYHRNL